jgi:hypothetical protein
VAGGNKERRRQMDEGREEGTEEKEGVLESRMGWGGRTHQPESSEGIREGDSFRGTDAPPRSWKEGQSERAMRTERRKEGWG